MDLASVDPWLMAHYSHRASRSSRPSRGRHHASAKGHIIGHVPPARDGVLRYVMKSGAVYETKANRGGARRHGDARKGSRKKGKKSSRKR